VSVAMDDTIRVTPLNSLTYGAGVKLPSQPLGGIASVPSNSGSKILLVACKEHIVVFQDGKVRCRVEALYVLLV
jgi:hypothetical protein